MYKGKIVSVKRGMAETTTIEVPVWEIKVLELVHGKSNVDPLKDVKIDREYEAENEYGRLGTKYGLDGERGISFVEAAYGTDIDKLEAAVKKAAVK